MSRFGDFAIESTILIDAPQRSPFGLIADLRAWGRWNAQFADDPTVRLRDEGPPAAQGSALHWQGRRAGTGRMEILELREPESVVVRVRFEAPFKVVNTNTFSLNAEAGATRLVWSMKGPKPLAAKLIAIVAAPEKLMMRHFAASLARLKAAAENER